MAFHLYSEICFHKIANLHIVSRFFRRVFYNLHKHLIFFLRPIGPFVQYSSASKRMSASQDAMMHSGYISVVDMLGVFELFEQELHE